MASTKDILDNHLKAFDQGDLNGVLSDYAPDAVFFTKDGQLKGVDAIRPLFEALIAEFGKPGATFNMKQQLVEGDYAYFLDGRDRRQRLRTGNGHVRRAGGQDCGPVIHHQDHAEGLENGTYNQQRRARHSVRRHESKAVMP